MSPLPVAFSAPLPCFKPQHPTPLTPRPRLPAHVSLRPEAPGGRGHPPARPGTRLVQGSNLPASPASPGLHRGPARSCPLWLLGLDWVLGSWMWGQAQGQGAVLAAPGGGCPWPWQRWLLPGVRPAGAAGAGPGFSQLQLLGNLRDSVAGKRRPARGALWRGAAAGVTRRPAVGPALSACPRRCFL